MNATDIAAWYATVVATVAFSWDMIKWFRSGPRLRIRVVANVYYNDSKVIGETVLGNGVKASDLEEYCHVEVFNVGHQPTTLLDISATSINKATKSQMFNSSIAFTIHTGSKPIPVLLSPGEAWSARIQMCRIDGLAANGEPRICIRASHSEKSIFKSIKVKPNPELSA